MDGTGRLWVRRYAGRPPPLVALHGFTQTGAMFAEFGGFVGHEVLAPDLPGHGRSAGVPASFCSAAATVSEVLASCRRPVPLIGYSQGGRVALAVALQRPELVSHLVLLSASAGIPGEDERNERRRADEDRALELKSMGLVAFIDQWLSMPMFTGLEERDSTWRTDDRSARLENTVDGLAAALVGMGQGAQPYLGDRLGELRMPVLVMAGAADEEYSATATDIAGRLRDAVVRILPDAGHAVIGECPRTTADVIRVFLAG